MVILLTGFHLLLIFFAEVRFAIEGELPLPVMGQFILNAAILVLIYAGRTKLAFKVFITTFVLSNFILLLASDLTNLLYVVPSFVAVSVLLDRKWRFWYAGIVILLVLVTGIVTDGTSRFEFVTHENVVLFAVLGVISVAISTSVVEGDLRQIKRQMQTLHESEKRYRLLAHDISDMVTLHAPDGRFLYASPSYIKATGFSEQELLEMPVESLSSLVHPDDIKRTRDEAHRQVLRGERITRLEYRRKRKDGSYFWVEAHSSPVVDENGQITQIVASTRDITERKMLEEALITSEAQLAEAEQVAHLGSWRWDVDTDKVTWSAELYRIFGVTPQTFGGSYQEYLALLHPDDRDRLDKAIRQAYQTKQPYSLYHDLIHPELGLRTVHGMGRVFTDSQGNPQYMFGTAQDVTDLVRVEKTLAVRNKYLTTLYEITLNLLNRRDIDDLLHAVVDSAASIMDTPYGEIMLLEGDELVVKAVTSNQSFLNTDRVKRGEGLLSWRAFDTQQTVTIDDYSTWPDRRAIYDHMHLRACVDFPIIVGDTCIGVLALARSKENYPFDEDQLEIGRMLSHLAALVVDNANHHSTALQEIAERKKTEQNLNRLTKELETRSQVEYEQRVFAETLHKTAAVLNSTLDVDEVLKLIMENIKQIIPHDASNIMLIDNGIARIVHVSGRSPELQTKLYSIGYEVQKSPHLNHMYCMRTPYIIDDVLTHPGWIHNLPDFEIRSYIAAPICVDDEVIGFLNLDSVTPSLFTQDHAHRLSAVVSHAGVALKNARLYMRSKALAAFEERQRLARELHDSVTQTLFAATVTSNAIIKRWRHDSLSVGEDLVELKELTQGALAEMRTLLIELRPNALLETNLSYLLRQLAETIKGRSRVNVTLDIDDQCCIAPDAHIALFRIAQEALNNVIKHARAHDVHIVLHCQQDIVEMSVSDNGRGFDPLKVKHSQFGLGIMRERADQAGIDLTIDSRLGEGTTIKSIWKQGARHE